MRSYVQDQASVLGTGEYPRDAWSSALTYEMIYEQPVVYELGEIKRPTLLIIGQDDRTSVGKNRLPPSLQPVAGQYPELGRRRHEAIKGLDAGRGSGLRAHAAYSEAGRVSPGGDEVLFCALDWSDEHPIQWSIEFTGGSRVSSSERKHAYSGAASGAPSVPEPSFAERARTLVHLGRIGSLSTLSRKQPGFPFGSVMPYSLDEQGGRFFSSARWPCTRRI